MQVCWQELPGLLCEVLEDRSRFEHADWPASASGGIVDDRRDTVIGRNPQELWPELLALADVDRNDAVGKVSFFEEDRDLVPVRGGPVVELNHDPFPFTVH